jgi:hypothetical protein
MPSVHVRMTSLGMPQKSTIPVVPMEINLVVISGVTSWPYPMCRGELVYGASNSES